MTISTEQEAKKLTQRAILALGPRLNTFYHQRFVALNNYLGRLLEEHNGCSDTITDAEIEGAYEMITEHLFPYSAQEIDEIAEYLNTSTHDREENQK
jgi:hypothetical protein